MKQHKNNGKTKRIRQIFTGPKEFTTFLAIGLAEEGKFTLNAIADECDMSIGAVLYRLKMAGINIRDIRNDITSRKARKYINYVADNPSEKTLEKTAKIKYIYR